MQDPERRPLPRPARSRREKANMHNEDYDDDDSLYPDDDDIDPASAFTLPDNRVRIALTIGVVAGLAIALIYFLVPFLDFQAFQQIAKLGEKIDNNTAVIVAGLRCMSIFVAIVICAFVGSLVGKYAVQRRLGFLAGLIAGAIFYLGQILASYIPNYPGDSAAPPLSLKYIVLLTIITLILGSLGGLISLLVTWMTTRKHPYYTGIWE